MEDRQVINGMVYKIRTGFSWRDLPEGYGPRKTVYTRFRHYTLEGVFTETLQHIQARADAAGDIDWLAQIDSTILRAHQHATATGRKGGRHQQDEPDEHALGRSRGRLTTKIHLACDGKGRPLAILVTPGQRHDSVYARFDRETYRRRNMIERCLDRLKGASAASPPDTKGPPPPTKRRSPSRHSCSGQDPF